LQGKTALVTGGGRGIGKGCALEFARAGADVVVNDRPGSPDLAETVEQLRSMGVRAEGIEANVFEYEGCEEVCRRAIEFHGRIDILTSNPAFSSLRNVLDYKQGEFEQIIAATLTSGFHMSRLVATTMVKRGRGGKILFISSVQAEMPLARCVAYGAAKAGLNHMSRTLAVELSDHLINVNVIEPGWIDTPGEEEKFGADVIRGGARNLPWRRLGRPDDIGHAAVFLCSDDADYITGIVLPVDGLYRFKDCRESNEPQPATE
jgi:glucose 1-dehydrogenase